MPNYANGEIYKLISYSNPQLVYYGSTTQSLSQRFANHKNAYNSFNRNIGQYMSSFELMRFDDAKIVLVERFPCETREELHLRENEYIIGNECINKNIAIITIPMKQYMKIYDETHNTEIKNRKKKYYELHKVEISNHMKLCRDDIQSISKLFDSLPFSGSIDRILPKDNVFCDTCGKLLKHGSMRLHIKRFHS